jgi:cephalosporin hydroxylase
MNAPRPFDDLNMTPEGEAYLRWFYDAKVWKGTTWHGVRTLKLPSDIWNYQEIIFDHGIENVIETGTCFGGSALFFAETLAARRGGRVVTIDVDGQTRQLGASHERIHFLVGDSAAPEMVSKALSLIAPRNGRTFLILDSDHSRDHVLRELRAWVPHLRSRDYLVVEDSVVNGNPVRPEHGPGPMEAIAQYLQEAPGLLIHDREREAKFGTTFAARGHYIRA